MSTYFEQDFRLGFKPEGHIFHSQYRQVRCNFEPSEDHLSSISKARINHLSSNIDASFYLLSSHILLRFFCLAEEMSYEVRIPCSRILQCSSDKSAIIAQMAFSAESSVRQPANNFSMILSYSLPYRSA